MKRNVTVLLILFFGIQGLFAGNPSRISQLLTPSQSSFKSLAGLSEEVSEGVLLDLNANQVHRLLRDKPEELYLSIEVSSSKTLTLNLQEVELLTPDFVLRTASGKVFPAPEGLYLRGEVEGMPGSHVSLSVFPDEVIGIIASPRDGNLVLGKLQGNMHGGQHILYKERDLLKPRSLECLTPDPQQVMDPSLYASRPQTRSLNNCVRIYLEIGHAIYNDKGGLTPTSNFITGLYNEVAGLYAVESINHEISEIFIWDIPDPYTQMSSSAILGQFQANSAAFNGNMAQLIDYGPTSAGLAAGLNGVCPGVSVNSMAYSSIHPIYQVVPAYSWTINVVTHEFGHLHGSPHTHSCSWGMPIDGCRPPEGGCGTPGPIPSNGGTIMSYCHLHSVGMNFANGFGVKPGNLIRNRMGGSSSCMGACQGVPYGTCENPVDTFDYAQGFENGLSGWRQSTQDDIDWTWQSGATPTSGTGPTSAYEGTYYMYVESSGTSNFPNKTAVLNTVCIDLSRATSADIEFWAHLYGSIVGSLHLDARTRQQSSWTTIWSQNGSAGPNWRRFQVNLASWLGDTVQLRFRGITGFSQLSDIALDDVQIHAQVPPPPPVCPSNVSTFPWSESFESDLGGWAQESNDDFDWSRGTGATPTTWTGPGSARDGNYYLFIEATGNSPQKTAILNGPCFDLSQETNATFEFYRHMYGSQVGSLVLEASADQGSNWAQVWSFAGNSGNSWKKESVDISSYAGGEVQLRFKAITGSGQSGDIAIDDMSMVPCSNWNLRVNFDGNFMESRWELYKGSTLIGLGGPHEPTGGKMEVEEWDFCVTDGCYRFIAIDFGGDGICCNYGVGSYTLRGPDGSILAFSQVFKYRDTTDFCFNASAPASIGPDAGSLEPEIRTYPNPASTHLRIELSNWKDGAAVLRLFDLQGKQVRERDFTVESNGSGLQELNLSGLSPGMYVLNIQSGARRISKKIIIQQ